jgi:hypothetical protein
VRVGLDPASGKLSKRQDTLYAGRFTNFTVTGDGGSIVIDEGTTETSFWALEVADAIKGRFSDARRLEKTSTPLTAQISPNGARILLSRTVPTSSGASERRLSVIPFDGGAEAVLNSQGSPVGAFWSDSVTVAIETQTERGTHVALLDVRTGAPGRTLDLPDSIYRDIEPLADGWSWIPADADRVVIQRAGKATEFPQPAWFASLSGQSHDPGRPRLAVSGWNTGSNDTLGVIVIPLDGGAPVTWVRAFSESGSGHFLVDGTLLLTNRATQEFMSLVRVRTPGHLEIIGTIPRPVRAVSVSDDLRRAAVTTSDYHGDAWMSRVVRP